MNLHFATPVTATDSSSRTARFSHHEIIGDFPSHRGFAVMHDIYQQRGGILCGKDLARRVEERSRGDLVSVARLIVSNEIFSFDWDNTLWVPMFQFEPRELAIWPAPRLVRAELSKVFEGWALAAWFARSNAWLNHQKPVDLLETHLPAVLAAARTDRYIAAG